MADIQGQSSDPSDRVRTGPVDTGMTALRVVGIGIGHGGGEAVRCLFATMPNDCDLTFVICLDTQSHQDDSLASMLEGQTSMPVRQLVDGTKLRGNAIYLMPPTARMILLKDRLVSFDDDEDGLSALPFDLFLHALAASSGSKAIAVLLSGAGEDGLRGAVSVQRAGGLLVVQDPDTATSADRPSAVINAGLDAIIAAPDQIAGVIERHIAGVEYDPGYVSGDLAFQAATLPDTMSGPISARLSEHYADRPAETIQPRNEDDCSQAALAATLRSTAAFHDDAPGLFDGMMEQNQKMLESTIDTLLASNDALRRRNRDLRLENQRLTAANAALDDIATMVAHDLKAPLRSIDHLTRKLEATFEATDGQESTAQGDVRHLQLRLLGLHRLIDDLLTYARQGTADDPGYEVVDISDLIREVLALIGLPSGFRIEVRPPSLSVRTRRIPLECIVRNLLCNAIRHHGGATGSIQVAVTDLETMLDIKITDDGQGMNGRGEGLGLAIVRQLLGAQAADLVFSSPASGQGTEARFTWPAEPAATG